MTTDYNKPTDLYQLQESRLDTIYRRHWVRFRSDHHTHQHTHCQNIPKDKIHSNCKLLPEDIVCKITQINYIKRANTCDPALKLLNEEITSDIQKHKQNIHAGHMDWEASWWTTSGNIGLPPLARVMGVGRQQQQVDIILSQPGCLCAEGGERHTGNKLSRRHW